MHALQNINEEVLSSHQTILDIYTQRALSSIRSKLKALIETKPLSNKLHTKVLIFRYERLTEFNIINLNDVSTNIVLIYLFRLCVVNII